MDDETDGWMEKASRPRRPLLYVIFTYMHNAGWAISCVLGVVCRVMAKEAGLF
jgi:hypothetical protein